MITRDEVKFMISLLYEWETEPPKGLDPTFYVMNSYEGDLDIYKKIKAIADKVNE